MKGKGPVFLTGLMGSGKSTVGRILAKKLGWIWVDLDDAIEKRAGRSIAAIFRDRGESAFRRLEKSELKRQDRPGRVVSCGGGVVLNAANRSLLVRRTTFYLAVPLEVLLGRLGPSESKKRPLLQGEELKAVLGRMKRERGRFYRLSATFVLRASDPPALVAERAFRRLQGPRSRATLLKP